MDVLVVDKYVRAGDSWRQRYDSLKLHDSKWYSELPYVPFPPTWPLFTPKNSLADWLEVFVWATGRQPVDRVACRGRASYDADDERWEVTIDRKGVERKLHPRHLVFATGWNRLARHADRAGCGGVQRLRLTQCLRTAGAGSSRARRCSSSGPARAAWTSPRTPSTVAPR